MLKRQNVPSRLIVFPDENYWILQGENSRFFYHEVAAWLNRWLSPERRLGCVKGFGAKRAASLMLGCQKVGTRKIGTGTKGRVPRRMRVPIFRRPAMPKCNLRTSDPRPGRRLHAHRLLARLFEKSV